MLLVYVASRSGVPLFRSRLVMHRRLAIDRRWRLLLRALSWSGQEDRAEPGLHQVAAVEPQSSPVPSASICCAARPPGAGSLAVPRAQAPALPTLSATSGRDQLGAHWFIEA